MISHWRIRTGSDSVLSDQDWTRTEKFHSPLISGRHTVKQCSSTFSVMVHPWRCFHELMHPIYLKDKPRWKAIRRSSCKETIIVQYCMKHTTKLRNLLHVINQLKPRNISFSISPLINRSMCVIEFLFRDLISHKQEKLLTHKYIVGIWLSMKIAFSAILSFFWHIWQVLSDAPHAYFGAPQDALCTPVEERCSKALTRELSTFPNVREEIYQFWQERSLLTMKFMWRFYWIFKRMVYLAKINNLPKHHGAGLQRCRTQCSCIGLRPTLKAVIRLSWFENRFS